MSPRQSVSNSAIELIKAFEGFRAKAVRLDDGRWMIGYGHTATAREGAQVSEGDAEALLLYDLIHASHAVSEHVHAPLNQNQFDALVAFVFNIGEHNFRGSITLRRLNEGRPLEAALAMALWRRSDVEGERIIVDSLVRRRSAEVALFLRPPEGWTPAPTPILPPRMDYDAVGFMPLQTPTSAHAAFGGETALAERRAGDQFEPPEEPFASEVAAQAVIERLEAIFAEPPPSSPEPHAKQSEAAPAPEPKVVEAPIVAPAMGAATRAKRQRPRIPLVVYLAFAVAGIGLLLLASLWGFVPQNAHVGGPSQAKGLALGGVGAVSLAVAAFLLLDRLGDSK
jgi:lysozyme